MTNEKAERETDAHDGRNLTEIKKPMNAKLERITPETAAGSVAGANEFEINEAGTSKKVTGTQIATFVLSGNEEVMEDDRIEAVFRYEKKIREREQLEGFVVDRRKFEMLTPALTVLLWVA